VPTGRYTDIIERLKPGAAAAGDVVDMDGKVLGRHDGIIHFTIGQRRGLKIAGPAPLYVVALDAATGASWSGPREALTMRRSPCATSTGSARATLDRLLDAGRIECSSRCARRGRRGRRSVGHGRRPGDRAGRRRGRRVAGPGLCVLRQRRGPGARARRRLHPRRGGDGQGGIVSEQWRGRLDRDTIEKAYDRWAPVYDMVFGRVFEQGRMASIAAAEAHVGPGGGRILEVGLGTGISLLSYRPDNRIVGIDISAGCCAAHRTASSSIG
jgi:hypothetical protein